MSIPPVKIPFTKPALTVEQQLALLKSRGMVVADDTRALHYLRQLNYYRLGAYWLPFEQNHNNHQFTQGTSFEKVVDMYVFDRELRLLVLDAIERVEVAVRTQWAYTLAHKYGAHAQLNSGIFKHTYSFDHTSKIQSLEIDYQQSKERFVQHIRNKYSESLPPIWAQVELITFGQLSKWYANLSSGQDRNAIAAHFGFDEVNFVPFMHHLTTIRNTCAHHGRLWNRDFTFTFKLPRHKPQRLVPAINARQDRKLYNTLATLAYLLDQICIEHHWRNRLIDLIDKHQIDVTAMGFPTNWKAMQFWMIQHGK